MRDECSALRQLLDGASTGLWQFGESTPTKGPMPRIVLPCSGEPFDFQEANKPERRMSLGDIAIEEIELLDPPPYPSTPSPVSISSRRDEGSIAESTTQTEAETCSDASIQTEEPVIAKSSLVDIAVQTDQPPSGTEPARTEQTNYGGMSTQTDRDTMKQTAEGVATGTQTEGNFKQVVDARDVSVQTHIELTFDVSVQTERSDDNDTPKAITVEISTQTNEEYPSGGSKAKVSEIAVQTDREHTKICFEATTQTDDLPIEISVEGGKSVDGVSMLETDDDIRPPPNAARTPEKWRPPKPKSFDGKRSEHSTPDTFQNSNTSLDFPKGSNHGGGKPSTTIPKWSAPSNPSKGVQDRLGSSMSQLQAPTASSIDWRSKLRQKGEDAASTPAAPPPKSPGKKKSTLPHPPSKEVPEFLNRFRELGIRADENEEDPPHEGGNNNSNEAAVGPGVSPGPPVATPNSIASSKSNTSSGQHPTPGPLAAAPAAQTGPKQPEWMSKFKEIGMKGEEKVIVAAGAKGAPSGAAAAGAEDDSTTAIVNEKLPPSPAAVAGGGTTKGPAPSVGARAPNIPKWKASLQPIDSVATSEEKEKFGTDSSGAGPIKAGPGGLAATPLPVPKWKTAAAATAAHDAPATTESAAINQPVLHQQPPPKWKAGGTTTVKPTEEQQPSVPPAFQAPSSTGPKWKAGSTTVTGGPAASSGDHAPTESTASENNSNDNAPEWMKKFKQIGQKGQERVT
jgi:hypothetical protein